MVDDNFRVNKIENECKAVPITGWIGEKGTQSISGQKRNAKPWDDHGKV